jgi:hypothetical protein
MFQHLAQASEIDETPAKAIILKSTLHVDTAKLVGVSRDKTIKLLGQPQRGEEFFPFSKHRTLVDYYELRAPNNKHLRITYDTDVNVSATEVEPAPLAIPKFMDVKVEKVTLTDAKLHAFLKSVQESGMQTMGTNEISTKLGKPDQAWHETSRAGGRDRHFLNFLYYLTADGQRAFVVMFDEASNSVYEYRLQSISN